MENDIKFIKKRGIIGAIIVLLMMVTLWFTLRGWFRPGRYDEFARCIAGTGTQVYVKSWCDDCVAQLSLFGGSARLLPQVECSTSTGTIKKSCTDLKIETFPTWQFAYGDAEESVLSLDEIAARTGCQLDTASGGE